MDSILVYRCCISNAIWFAGRVDCGHSVTVAGHRTYSFAEGEMLENARFWFVEARKAWKLLTPEQRVGLPSLDSIVEAVKAAHAETAALYRNLAFPNRTGPTGEDSEPEEEFDEPISQRKS